MISVSNDESKQNKLCLKINTDESFLKSPPSFLKFDNEKLTSSILFL